MKRKHRKKPARFKEIALQRINILFEQAELRKNEIQLSNRYVQLARLIAMKYKVRMPTSLKRRYCKHCYSYLVFGKTARVRLQKRKVVYSCLCCKKFMRFVR